MSPPVTWFAPAVDPLFGGIVFDVAFSPDGSIIAAGGVNAAGYGSVAVSQDGGVTWTVSATPAFPVHPGIVESLAVADDGTILAGGADGGGLPPGTPTVHTVTVSHDAGLTWSQPATDPFGGFSSGTGQTGECRAVAIAGSALIAVGNNAPLTHCFARSIDGGATWSYAPSDPFAGGFGLALTAMSDTTLIAGGVAHSFPTTNKSLARSIDGGATWAAVAADPFAPHSCDTLSSDSTYVLAGSSNQAAAWSADGGITWTTGLSTYEVEHVAVGPRAWLAEVVPGIGFSYVQMSTDNGATWVPQTGAQIDPLGGGDVASVGSILAAGGESDVLNSNFILSVDLGATWLIPPINAFVKCNAVAIHPHGRLAVFGGRDQSGTHLTLYLAKIGEPYQRSFPRDDGHGMSSLRGYPPPVNSIRAYPRIP